MIPLIITAGLQFLFQLGALRAEVAPDKVALRIKLDDILQGERGEPVTPTMGAVGREMDERNQYAETVQQGDADRVQLSQADTKRLVEELMQAAGTPLEPSIAKWMIDASLRLGPAAALTAMIGSMYQQN